MIFYKTHPTPFYKKIAVESKMTVSYLVVALDFNLGQIAQQDTLEQCPPFIWMLKTNLLQFITKSDQHN